MYTLLNVSTGSCSKKGLSQGAFELRKRAHKCTKTVITGGMGGLKMV